MNSGLQNIVLGINEGKLKDNKLLFEIVDYSHCFETNGSKIKEENVHNEYHLGDGQKIDNLRQDMHTQFQNKIKLEKVQGDKCENYDSHSENVDCTHFSETTGSVICYTDNLQNNIGTRLRNIKQEVEVNEDRTENLHSTFGNNSNLYIFENTNSNFHGKDNVDTKMLVDILHIKQEVTEYPEKRSNLGEENCSQDVKYKLNLQDAEIKTEIIDYRIHADNSYLEAQKFENSNCDVENSGLKMELSNLKPENESATCSNKKNDCKLENTGLDIDTSDFTFEKTDLGIEKCDSRNGAVGFMEVKFDSERDTLGVDNHSLQIETDFQPTVVSKGQPGFSVFNQGSPAYQINDSCNPNDIASSTSCVSERRFSQETQLEVEQPYHCSICDKRFKSAQTLKYHMTSHSSEQLYECNVCGLSANNIHFLKQHLITHNNDQPLKCNICQKVFKKLSHVSKHQLVHSNVRPYKCNICNQKFKVSNVLKHHMKTHSNERPYKCDICQKELKTSSNLKRHLLTHSTERPYKCDICKKAFKSSPHLNHHLKYHSNERPFKCDICKKKFKASNVLKVHLISHSTERPYKCDICKKEFKTSDALKKHLETHSNQRQYKCDICQKTYKTPYILKKHLITHNTERQYMCDICQKTFKTPDVLRKHRLRHSMVHSA